MSRRVTMLALATGMFLSVGCCWWRRPCGDGCATSWSHGPAPCHLTGRGPEPCCDTGVPFTGPVTPGVPGPAPVPPPYELPMPQPSTLIPSPNVPLAPPSVAPDPGPVGGLRSGQPIRTGR
jgi:hypothetical protein